MNTRNTVLTQRVDASALSDNPMSSHEHVNAHKVTNPSSWLFQVIVRLAYAQQMLYTAPTAEAKGKAILQVNLLKAERDRLLGTMLS